MKLLLVFVISVFPLLVNAQKKDRIYIGLQVQPELTFYKSSYIAVYPPAYSKASFNIGFNMYGQYQITDRLFTTLGLGFISRKLNTTVYLAQSRLPPPYYDTVAGPAIFPKRVFYRILQMPVGLGYYFFRQKKINCFASLAFIPNFLLNTKYGDGIPYPAFKKNYWQGYSLNPNLGIDYSLTSRLKLNSTLTYSIVNTVRAEEFDDREPVLKHRYLQLGLGAKLKLK